MLSVVATEGSLEDVAMESMNETTAENRKEWLAPQLKKIDVEQITAAGGGSGEDIFALPNTAS
jgi:hypothetical protein